MLGKDLKVKKAFTVHTIHFAHYVLCTIVGGKMEIVNIDCDQNLEATQITRTYSALMLATAKL